MSLFLERKQRNWTAEAAWMRWNGKKITRTGPVARTQLPRPRSSIRFRFANVSRPIFIFFYFFGGVVLFMWCKLAEPQPNQWWWLCSVSQWGNMSLWTNKVRTKKKKRKKNPPVTCFRSCGSNCICRQDVVILKTGSSMISWLALQVHHGCLQVERGALVWQQIIFF